MKKIILIIIAGVVLSLGVFFLFTRKSVPKQEIPDEVPTPTVALPTISDDVKVDVQFGSNNGSIVLTIGGFTPDIESIEYELTYLTGAGLPRGVLGKIILKGEKTVKRDDIVLGTCSSGKCVYDTGVKSVDLSLKFNASSSSQVFQKSYSLK